MSRPMLLPPEEPHCTCGAAPDEVHDVTCALNPVVDPDETIDLDGDELEDLLPWDDDGDERGGAS